MGAIVWTHKCRLYRPFHSLSHDLHPMSSVEDIYAVDKDCRMESGTTEILTAPAMGALGLVEHPAELWFPRGLDIIEGTFARVRKPRVINGDREQVLGTLSVEALTSATSLTMDTTTGFESGDEAEITDGTNRQMVKIKTVSATVLTLYPESALLYDFAADATTVAVDYWYAIYSVLSPHGFGPIIKTVAIRKHHTDIDTDIA